MFEVLKLLYVKDSETVLKQKIAELKSIIEKYHTHTYKERESKIIMLTTLFRVIDSKGL